MDSRQAVAAVVLAGGASRRMGREKALLLLPDGRIALQAVVETAQAVADPVLLAVRSSADGERLLARLRLPIPDLLVDQTPGAGPLHALAGALAVPATLLLALAVDTPLVRPELLRVLTAALISSGYPHQGSADSAETQWSDKASMIGAREQCVPEVYRDHPPDSPVDSDLSQPYNMALPVVGGVAQPLPACYAAALAPLAGRLAREGASSLRALHTHAEVHACLLDEATLRRADPDLRSFIGANTPEEWERLVASWPGHDP